MTLVAARIRRSRAALAVGLIAAGAAHAAPPRTIDKADYASRLHGMWLAECIANWTGLKTEGRRPEPPFLTDSDWATNPFPEAPFLHVNYVLNPDPWLSDDDTDIEYVYLHLLTQHAPALSLSPRQIADGWIAHCNWAIWVSNAAARSLMNYGGVGAPSVPLAPGVEPPATAFAQGFVWPSYTDQSLMIDAQLTTEFFGALAPGLPGAALDLADLPIRTTATGYAMHAAQFHVVLYSLATQVDRSLPPQDQALWLVRQARKFIPDSSKSADIVDFVLADFLANPDPDDWERTRDAVYQRYQLNAAANGFRYRAWYESSVNFATGLIALLYGRMDLLRTIRIGTLSGWDSDNGTATMGGLLGLIMGHAGVVDAVAAGPGWPSGAPSDRYSIAGTRSNMPDHLPADPAAEDTLTLMAQRAMPIIERVILGAGGRSDASRWLLPPGGAGDGLAAPDALLHVPSFRHQQRSANASLNSTGGGGSGGTAAVSSSIPGSPSHWSFGTWFIPALADNLEHESRGREIQPGSHGFISTQRSAALGPFPAQQWLAVEYSQPRTIAAVRLVEGDHFAAAGPAGGGDYRGGWFESASIEVRVGAQWLPVQAAPSEPLDPQRPFQVVDFVFAAPIPGVWGVRIVGLAGGGAHPGNPTASPFVSAAELDALGPPVAAPPATFDLNLDGSADTEDLYAWHALPQDLDLDGHTSSTDTDYLRAAIRWSEPPDVVAR